jgi:hypothetical protein
MTVPLSQDLLRRLVQATGAGSSARDGARRFALSESAPIKLVRRARDRQHARRPGSMGISVLDGTHVRIAFLLMLHTMFDLHPQCATQSGMREQLACQA